MVKLRAGEPHDDNADIAFDVLEAVLIVYIARTSSLGY
jgi:hypothetical protein